MTIQSFDWGALNEMHRLAPSSPLVALTNYPERLEQAGVSWKVYQDEGTGLDSAGSWGWTSDPYIGNYGDNSPALLQQLSQRRTRKSPVRQGSSRHQRP